MVGVFLVGCTGEREIKTVKPDGVEVSTLVDGADKVCSKSVRTNPGYSGKILALTVSHDGRSAKLLLTPKAAGLGGSSWTTEAFGLELAWDDTQGTINAILVHQAFAWVAG